MTKPLKSLGDFSIADAIQADNIILGVSRDKPGCLAVALGRVKGLVDDIWLVFECPPAEARKIAASLMNKADSVEERGRGQ